METGSKYVSDRLTRCDEVMAVTNHTIHPDISHVYVNNVNVNTIGL